MRTKILGLLLIAFFFSFTITGHAQAAPHDRKADLFLIRARLFRQFIRPGIRSYDEVKNPCYKEWASKWKVCYLEIDDKHDPDQRLMALLTNLGRPVKPISALHLAKPPKDWQMYSVVDAESGTIGFTVSVDKIRWVNRNRVKAEAGYHSGGLYGGWAVFTLVRRQGAWVIIKADHVTIS